MFLQRTYGFLKLIYLFIFLVIQQSTKINSLANSERMFEHCNLYFATIYDGKSLKFPEYFDSLITQQTTDYTPVSLMINIRGYNESGWRSVNTVDSAE